MRTDGRTGRQAGMVEGKEDEANILLKATYIRNLGHEDILRERPIVHYRKSYKSLFRT